MLVVADSSPLNVLIRIGCVEVLANLFHTVAIPPQVAEELNHARTPQAVKDFTSPPSWLVVRGARKIDPVPSVDRGEEVAINLALELKAELLLIDDLDCRKAAAARHLAVIDALGVLQRAAMRDLLDLESAITRMRQTDFRAADELLDQALRRPK